MLFGRYFRSFALPMMTGLAVGMIGCRPDPAVKDPGLIGRGVKEPTPPGDRAPASQPGAIHIVAYGTVSGTILFKGKAPSATIDTSLDPGCAADGKATLPTEQYVVKDGRLANVFLYVKSGPPDAMLAGNITAQPVVMDQQHCRYVPHVIGVAAGGYVDFRNSDPTMHNVHTNPTDIGNETIDISEGPRSKSQMKQLAKPELMIPVRCNNHPWMSAFINVAPTQYFAVSDADGHFEIRGLPPGDYVIGAVHEKMGEKTMKITVLPRETANAEFSFAP